MSAWDKQVDGSHYKDLPIQPFQYSMANGLDPMQHTAIKYVTRFRDKGGVRDLRAAIHTIELLIAWEESKAAPGKQIEAEPHPVLALAKAAEPARPLTPQAEALSRFGDGYVPRACAIPASKTYANPEHSIVMANEGDEVLIFLEDEGFTWRPVRHIADGMDGVKYNVPLRVGQTSILMVPSKHTFGVTRKDGTVLHG